MSNLNPPGSTGSPGGNTNGQSAPAPAQAASLTGYTPPDGEDEIVEELAEEIVDDVIEDAVVAPVAAAPPPTPVAAPAPVVRAASPVPPSTPAAPAAPVAPARPVTPPPAGPSRADMLLDALAADENRRAIQSASAPVAPVSSSPAVEPRVTYTAAPPPAAPAAPPADPDAEEVIEDAVDLGTAPAAAAPAPADLHVDLDEFSTAVDTAPRPPRPRSTVPKAVAPPSSLQSTSIPVLITVGLLLLGPGIWSVLILLGKTDIPGGEREDAKKMASLFWICLPMGLLLITGAIYFLTQMRDEARARKERYDFALAKAAAEETARVEAEQAAQARAQAAAAQQAAPAPAAAPQQFTPGQAQPAQVEPFNPMPPAQ